MKKFGRVFEIVVTYIFIGVMATIGAVVLIGAYQEVMGK